MDCNVQTPPQHSPAGSGPFLPNVLQWLLFCFFHDVDQGLSFQVWISTS